MQASLQIHGVGQWTSPKMTNNNNYLYLKENNEVQFYASQYRFCYCMFEKLYTQFPRGYIHVKLFLQSQSGFQGNTLRYILDKFCKRQNATTDVIKVGEYDPFLFAVSWVNYDHCRPLCILMQALCQASCADAPPLSTFTAAYLDFIKFNNIK